MFPIITNDNELKKIVVVKNTQYEYFNGIKLMLFFDDLYK